MEDWNNNFIIRKNSSGFEEFEEEDVLWNNDNARDHPITSHATKKKLTLKSSSSSSSSSSSAWKLSNTSTTPRKIPKRDLIATTPKKKVTHNHHHHQQSSAPMNIPDWSKIYGNININNHDDDDSYDIINDHDHDDGDDNDDGDDMVPPHEWIAKKLARSQISSFSVCEGIGRTLKGRDLSKVRNAILTKTGFLE